MGEIEIRQKLIDEIEDYCKFNDMTNVDEFIHNMLEKGFNIEKYGNVPEMYKPDAEVIEKPIEVVKEVIKEVVKEVPVEKIVEKEVIKEVTVEIIKEVIKEVPIEIIKEVIKEVPVDKVITVDKEIAVDKIVEKRVTVKDDTETKRLKEKITQINLDNRKKIRTFEIDNDNLKSKIISLKEKVFELESKPPKIVEKPIEVIREVIKTIEVPKEIIKEVIKEVPVEKVVIQEKPVEVIKEVIPHDKIRYHMLVVDVKNKLYESKIVLKESDIDKFINKADAKYHMKTVETLKDYHIIKKVLIKPYYDRDGRNYDIYGE